MTPEKETILRAENAALREQAQALPVGHRSSASSPCRHALAPTEALYLKVQPPLARPAVSERRAFFSANLP